MKIAGSAHNHIHVVLGSCDTGNQDDGGDAVLCSLLIPG